SALDQGTQHGEEPAARRLDRRRVGAILGHVSIPGQQVGARHPDIIKGKTAIINAVEPALETVIFTAHTRQAGARRTVFEGFSDRYIEGVDSVIYTVGDELGKDHGRGSV